MTELDVLYKELFDAQLLKNWGKVARIQKEINKHPESYREERESPVEQDSPNLRDHEGTV